MRYLPSCLQKIQVKKTTVLLAKQYRSFSQLYRDPLDSQAQIFENIIRHRYHQQKDKSYELSLLPYCNFLLDLRELVIEILDYEHGFNHLELKRQIQFENHIFEILEENGIT